MLLSLKFLSLFVKKNPVSWKSNVLFSFKCNPMDRGAWRAIQSMESYTVHGELYSPWRAIQSMESYTVHGELYSPWRAIQSMESYTVHGELYSPWRAIQSMESYTVHGVARAGHN